MCTVLGPLPRLHRLTVSVAAVLTFVGAGAWAASVLPYPHLVGAGAGLALGTLFAYLLLHVSDPAAAPRGARRTHLP